MDNLTLIANYKADERHARLLAVSGLNNLLKSAQKRAEIAENAEYAEPWSQQNAKLPPEAQNALGHMESLVNQLHALMWALHTSYGQAEPGGDLFPGIAEPET